MTGNGGTGKISVQLLRVLIPMIAFFIILVAAIIVINSRTIITEQATNGLEEESQANANDIAKTMSDIMGYYNGVGDMLESSNYRNNDDIKAAIQPGMTAYPGICSFYR